MSDREPEDPVTVAARELADHTASCPACQHSQHHRGRCVRRRELAADWRRALREAGQQT